MTIGISKALLDNEIRNEQQKSLNELINDIQSTGIPVVIFEPKDRNYTISLTNGQIYETEVAFRSFYNNLMLSQTSNSKVASPFKNKSRKTFLFLGIFPLTGIFGLGAFYFNRGAKYIFLITNCLLVPCLLSQVFLSSCSGSCVFTIGALLLIPTLFLSALNYIISVVDTISYAVKHKSDT